VVLELFFVVFEGNFHELVHGIVFSFLNTVLSLVSGASSIPQLNSGLKRL